MHHLGCLQYSIFDHLLLQAVHCLPFHVRALFLVAIMAQAYRQRGMRDFYKASDDPDKRFEVPPAQESSSEGLAPWQVDYQKKHSKKGRKQNR